MNGDEVQRFGPSAAPNTFSSQQNFNFLITEVTTNENMKNFVSYMWFNQSHFSQDLSVTCTSDENEDKMTVQRYYGNTKLIWLFMLCA